MSQVVQASSCGFFWIISWKMNEDLTLEFIVFSTGGLGSSRTLLFSLNLFDLNFRFGRSLFELRFGAAPFNCAGLRECRLTDDSITIAGCAGHSFRWRDYHIGSAENWLSKGIEQANPDFGEDFFARRTGGKSVVEPARKCLFTFLKLSLFIVKLAAFLSVRPKPLFASFDALFGPRTGPLVRTDLAALSEEKDHHPAVRHIGSVAGRLIFGLLILPILFFGKHQYWVKLTASLVISLAIRVRAAREEVLLFQLKAGSAHFVHKCQEQFGPGLLIILAAV